MDVLKVDVPDLPEGSTPLEAVVVVKCLDNHGSPTIAVRVSEGLMAWEAVGMLIAASDMARGDLQSDFFTLYTDSEDPDNDDED